METARTTRGIHFATLTDIIYQNVAGKTAKEYKQFKGLKKESLRDNMTNTELALNMLAEAATTELSKERIRNISKNTKLSPNKEEKQQRPPANNLKAI